MMGRSHTNVRPKRNLSVLLNRRPPPLATAFYLTNALQRSGLLPLVKLRNKTIAVCLTSVLRWRDHKPRNVGCLIRMVNLCRVCRAASRGRGRTVVNRTILPLHGKLHSKGTFKIKTANPKGPL